MRTAVYCATRNLYGDMETAAKSLLKNTPSRPYVNYGVSFHNLKKQREDRIPKKAARLLNRKAYEAAEQDVMNELCRGHILLLPGGWNISNWTDGNFLERKIRHYAAEGKSRYGQPLWLMYERMPWEKVRPQVSRK